MKFIIFLVCVTVSFAQQTFIGAGETMSPAFENGALVTVWPAKFETLKPGDAVAFQFNDEAMVSRLIAVENGVGVMRADANKENDSVALTEKNFLGTIFSECERVNVFHRFALKTNKDFYLLNGALGECNNYSCYGGGSGLGIWTGSSGGGGCAIPCPPVKPIPPICPAIEPIIPPVGCPPSVIIIPPVCTVIINCEPVPPITCPTPPVFTPANPPVTPSPNPIPHTPEGAVSLVFIVAGLGLILFFKKCVV
jgi:hypothetical protein